MGKGTKRLGFFYPIICLWDLTLCCYQLKMPYLSIWTIDTWNNNLFIWTEILLTQFHYCSFCILKINRVSISYLDLIDLLQRNIQSISTRLTNKNCKMNCQIGVFKSAFIHQLNSACIKTCVKALLGWSFKLRPFVWRKVWRLWGDHKNVNGRINISWDSNQKYLLTGGIENGGFKILVFVLWLRIGSDSIGLDCNTWDWRVLLWSIIDNAEEDEYCCYYCIHLYIYF